MENTLINPEDFIKEFGDDLTHYEEVVEAMKEYARLCCEEQKRVCARNAKCEEGAIVDLGFEIVDANVDEDSILNCPNVVNYE